jgi:hypothetical protein
MARRCTYFGLKIGCTEGKIDDSQPVKCSNILVWHSVKSPNRQTAGHFNLITGKFYAGVSFCNGMRCRRDVFKLAEERLPVAVE